MLLLPRVYYYRVLYYYRVQCFITACSVITRPSVITSQRYYQCYYRAMLLPCHAFTAQAMLYRTGQALPHRHGLRALRHGLRAL